MQTEIAESLRHTPLAQEADQILRSCVHCGFCTATCPTYQLTGDELDGPRGRIYLIKSLLEGNDAGTLTRHHLDRCLGCRACETTCPSGVHYTRLLALGQAIIGQQSRRGAMARLQRWLLQRVVPHRLGFKFLLRLGQSLRPLLPRSLSQRIPKSRQGTAWPKNSQTRRMLVLESCTQSSASPNTNAAAARVLDRLGIQLVRVKHAGCCGALDDHLECAEAAKQRARNNIDAWWPIIEQGAEAIVITASGCGTTVKDYGSWLVDDPVYRERAVKVASMTRDLSEVVGEVVGTARERIKPTASRRIAFHAPCSLQHGQRITGLVEGLLEQAGYQLTLVKDSHLCCGSAGPYSFLQTDIADALRERKLGALQAGEPEAIATANIGCQLHLQAGTDVPVRHWIELLDEAM